MQHFPWRISDSYFFGKGWVDSDRSLQTYSNKCCLCLVETSRIPKSLKTSSTAAAPLNGWQWSLPSIMGVPSFLISWSSVVHQIMFCSPGLSYSYISGRNLTARQITSRVCVATKPSFWAISSSQCALIVALITGYAGMRSYSTANFP